MIYDLYKTVLTISNKERGGEITPSKFDILVNSAQRKKFAELMSDYRRSFSKYQNNKEKKMAQAALDVFFFEESISRTGTNKYFDLSDLSYNYASIEAVTYLDTIPVALIENHSDKPLIRRSNKIYATLEEPIGDMFSNKLYIYPETIGRPISGASKVGDVVVQYYRYPEPCSLVLDGGTVIDDDTYDIELPEYYFNQLVVLVLEQVGITLREEQVANYANVEQQQNFQSNNL